METLVMCYPQVDFAAYQTVQVVETFHVRWEATAILLADLHLVVTQSCSLSFVLGYHDTSILHGNQNWLCASLMLPYE